MNLDIYMGIIDDLRSRKIDLSKYKLSDIKAIYKGYIKV